MSEQFPNLLLQAGRLTVLRELPFHGRELEMACRRLLVSSAPELVIDLTRLGYLASPQMGALAAASARAAEVARPLRILVCPALDRFLQRMKLGGILEYEVAGEAGDGPPPS
jgi:hypothetical protein